MALCREQIEHLERRLANDKPWKNFSHSRRWNKKQIHKYMRLQNKKIEEDDIGRKSGRLPLMGWEY